MRRFSPALAPLAALAVLAAPVPASALLGVGAGVRGIYWFPDTEATVQTLPGGTSLDLKDDLGVKDEDYPGAEAFLRLGDLYFRVGYTAADYAGSAVVSSVDFGGLTYAGAVATTADLSMLDGEVQWDFISPSVGVAGFSLGVIGKVKYVDASVTLTGSPGSATQDFSAPIPMVGAAAGLGILKDFLRVDVRAAGMGYSGSHVFEGDAFASVIPFPFLRIQAGYRIVDFKIDESDSLGEVTLKGPYAGLQLAF